MFLFQFIIKRLTFQQVTGLQESNSVLWIPSELWFSFLSRRLNILNNVHEKIYRLQPPNYGVISGLFSYLMQSVIFTPPMVNTYIRESLAALQYQRNCDVFGMFFLDSLDLDNQSCMIEGILEEDDGLVKSILGHLVRKPRLYFIRPEEDDDIEDSHFPIGRRPTWQEISASIESNPMILMRRWEGIPDGISHYAEDNCDNGSMESRAGLIFRKFTRQLWMSLHDHWRVNPRFPISPQTVEEAIKSWSLEFVVEHCQDPTFRACTMPGIQHVSGRRVPTFGERRIIYFPSEEVSTKKSNFWTTFCQDPGYLYDYWKSTEELNQEECTELEQCLEELLENCQCLPDSARSKSTNRGWHVKHKRVLILTNPKYYRILGVGERSKKKRSHKNQIRSAPAHRSVKETVIQMMEDGGHTREATLRALNIKKGIEKRRKKQVVRSKRAKNKRVPPSKANRRRELGSKEDMGDSSGEERTKEEEDRIGEDETGFDEETSESDGTGGSEDEGIATDETDDGKETDDDGGTSDADESRGSE